MTFWEAAAALAAWTAVVGGLFHFILRLTIKSAITDALKELPQFFLSREVAEEKFKAITIRLDSIEETLHELIVKQ